MMVRPEHCVLVTGGAGFIGSHAVEELLARGFYVVVYDNFSTGTMSNLESFSYLPGTLEVIEGDLRDSFKLRSTFRRYRPDVVIHLAALTSVAGSIAEPELCDDINIGGVINLLRAMEQYGTRRLIFASTSALYGDAIPPHRESAVTHHRSYLSRLSSPYAKSKLIGEHLIGGAPVESVIFRFFNVYGERQPLSGGYPAVIPSFLHDLAEEGEITIFGDGMQSRDFIYAGDVARALADALEREVTGIYNLCSGEGITILELAELVSEIAGIPLRIHFQPGRPGEIRESWGSVRKLRNELCFYSQVELPEGLARLTLSNFPLPEVAAQ